MLCRVQGKGHIAVNQLEGVLKRQIWSEQVQARDERHDHDRTTRKDYAPAASSWNISEAIDQKFQKHVPSANSLSVILLTLEHVL